MSSESRVRALVAEAHDILADGIQRYVWDEGRMVAATCVLYSGGNDSTTLAHIFKDVADFAIHANTTIGIERTRQFVRDTCAGWGLDLMEELPPTSYRELVLDQGFPGPGHHFKMYQRLKERCLRQARAKLVSNPRKERVVFLAGRRRSESKRRANIPMFERVGSTVWISPLALWDRDDLVLYREMFDVPENPVAKALGMSGECLCGSFAQPGELERIAQVDPDAAAEIWALEEEVRLAGKARCQWGWGATKDVKPSKSGALCSSCDARFDSTDHALDFLAGAGPEEGTEAALRLQERLRLLREGAA